MNYCQNTLKSHQNEERILSFKRLPLKAQQYELNYPIGLNNGKIITNYHPINYERLAQAKKLPEAILNLRQTFNNSNFQNLKSYSKPFSTNKSKIEENLRKTVDIPYKEQKAYSQTIYSIPQHSYKIINSHFSTSTISYQENQKKNNSMPNYTNYKDYQNDYKRIADRLNNNAQILNQIKNMKYRSSKYNTESSIKYKFDHIQKNERQKMQQKEKNNKVLQKMYVNPKKYEYNEKLTQKRPIDKQKIEIKGFSLLKKLGEGKFGAVFLVKHQLTNSLFAIKKVSKDMIKNNMMVDQFITQVKLQSFFNHQNIIKLYGFFADQDFIYLILEFMEQGTLFNYIKMAKKQTEQEAALKLRDISSAIRYMHQNGVAHRDIKPENVVISNNVCKICDFGWATLCDERRKTYCGTFDYAAPQILEGIQYDMSVDLWCLGVLSYELMVGKVPFYHLSRKQTMKNILNVQEKPIKYPSNISKKAISFIQSLIRKNPLQRMQNSQILAHPFLQIQNQEGYL